jgi:hypothetical protein
MRTVRSVAVVGALLPAVVGLAACGSSGGGAGSSAPAVPKGTFCQVVLAWSDAGVGTVNHFSRVSPDAADVGARRRSYFQAWDGLDAISSWVDSAADRAPAAVRAALHTAADEVRATVASGRDKASRLPDRAYEYASVQDGTLFVSNEKSRAIVYRTLDRLRGELGEQVVPRACGRQTEPVTLPVVTPP